jgi:hypothetical protein
MSKTGHRIFISAFAILVILAVIWLIYNGMSYYSTSIEERVYHPDHSELKPGGYVGHGIGIAGSFFMIFGMISYMARKRYRFLSRTGSLKYWLEFHIFLCTLGPILVLFHTSYKIGGLVAISFWSMVAVFISGIIGRFIYIQIPHTIEGRELSLSEIRNMKSDLSGVLRNSCNLDEESINLIIDSIKRKVELYQKNSIFRYIKKSIADQKTINKIKSVLKGSKLPKNDYHKVLGIVRNEIILNRRIDRLEYMQNLFKYWHVAHLPFALVMLIIMTIHVGVTVLFGYRWIF